MPIGQPDPPESMVERTIREAMESGEFDDLPGEGLPIPGKGGVDDPLWWLRRWVERNRDQPAEPPNDSS